MEIRACPIEEVAAPPSVLWELLTTPALLGQWADADALPPSPEPVRAGQTVALGARPLGLRVYFDYLSLEPERNRLRIRVRLPFGVTNDETVILAPLPSGGTRVTFG